MQSQRLGSAQDLPSVGRHLTILVPDCSLWLGCSMYNAVTREMESELVPCCRKYGIRIVIYNPLA